MTNEIDWTKAPEGATHYTKETNVTAACWVKLKDDSCGYITMSHHQNHLTENIWQIGEFHTSELTVIPKPLQPAFTQKMADAGELPHSSLLVQLRRDYGDDNEFYNGRCISEHNGVIWFIDDKYGGQLHSMNEITIRPIEPPIELEGDEFYSFEYSNVSYRGIYSKKEDRFFFADGHVMASYCKSIKLLEVK